MSRSSSIDIRKSRLVVELTNELQELPREPGVRRDHLLRQLCRLFDARVSFLAVMRVQPNRAVQFLAHGCGGWVDQQAVRYLDEYADASHVQDPMMPAIVAGPYEEKTFVRREVMPDRTWYRTEHFNEVATLMGIDDRMYAVFPFDERGGIVGIGIHRELRGGRFGQRERALASLLRAPLVSLAQLHAQPKAPEPVATLPPRLRQTLKLLLTGHSEKEIAAALRLSRHTVHDCVKRLYARLEVGSRAALMAKFIA